MGDGKRKGSVAATLEAIGSIAKGYAKLAKSIVLALAAIAVSLGLTAAVAYPLWYLSLNHRKLYALALLSVLALAAAFALAGRLRSSLRSGARASEIILRVLKGLGKVILTLLVVLLAVPIAVLFARGKTLYGALALVPYAAIAGTFFFRKRRKVPRAAAGDGEAS
jgi:hypothetical protein